MNVTRPNDINHHDSPEDWLGGVLIFSRAISYFLKDNQGIVIDLKANMKFTGDITAKRVIVYRSNERMCIAKYENMETPEGQLAWVHIEDAPEENEKQL